MFAAWQSANPTASADERVAMHQALAQRWQAMSEAQRLAEIHAASAAPADGVTMHDDAPPLAATPDVPLWSSGCTEWPIDPSALEDLVGTGRGVVASSQYHRWRARTRIFMQADNTRIPPRPLAGTCACSEAHPGLCITEDAAIYTTVMACAHNIQRYLKVADIGCCLQFATDSGVTALVQLANVRARRPKVPQMHVFLTLSANEDITKAWGDAGDCTDSSNPYTSAWTLTRMLLDGDDTQQALVHRASHVRFLMQHIAALYCTSYLGQTRSCSTRP